MNACHHWQCVGHSPDEASHQWVMRRALTCISYQKCEYKA